MISFDCETYSKQELRRVGAFRYAEDPSTEVLCAAWAIDGGPVHLWRQGDEPPDASTFEGHDIWAYNAQFDSLMWYYVLAHRHGWPWPGWHAFRCSMVSAAYGNLPGSLGEVAKALGTHDKDAVGSRLMKRLCKPAHETMQMDDPKRLHTREALASLGAYCMEDVEAERALHPRLPPLPADEVALWQLDQEINRRGVWMDAPLVDRLVRVAAGMADVFRAELQEVTHGEVESETKLAALASFLRGQGVQVNTGRGSMDADAVDAFLLRPDLPPAARRALELRRMLGKSSLAKLSKMLSAVCRDGRLRGLLQFYGAHQTGRWAGRLVQPQNLPKGVLEGQAAYDAALAHIRQADDDMNPEWLVAVYGSSAMDILSACIRPCLAAPPGSVLAVADYSAIEARVLAWLASEEWRLEVFRGHGKIYEASAARTLGIPIESIKKGSKERGCGKVTELALGYQGGPKALERFGAVSDYGIPPERLKPIVDAWRAASPNIVRLWRGMEDAAKAAIRQPRRVFDAGKVAFSFGGEHLRMRLPSGRLLYYRNAHLREGPAPWDPDKTIDKIHFWGEDEGGRWGLQDTYGGKLVENATQAVARDLMAHGMIGAKARGLDLVLSVHDELVAEEPEKFADRALAELEEAMCDLPKWAAGMPVKAEGWVGPYYRK